MEALLQIAQIKFLGMAQDGGYHPYKSFFRNDESGPKKIEKKINPSFAQKSSIFVAGRI
jgi:hypothetical protein